VQLKKYRGAFPAGVLPPFSASTEKALMVNAMGIWVAQGLMLLADTLRVLLKDYIKDTGPDRFQAAQYCFGSDACPGRRWFEFIVGQNREHKPDQPSPLEEERVQAATPAAVAKTFGAPSYLTERLHIPKAHQVYNMDDSMFAAEELMEGARKKV